MVAKSSDSPYDGIPAMAGHVGIVLVHGGCHTARCWDPLLPYLSAPTLAVDLPGRGSRPADLRSIGIDDFASAVVEDVEGAGLPHRLVLVGHSLAGITLPPVAAKLADRVAHLVFVSCIIPPEGATLLESLPPLVGTVTRWLHRGGIVRRTGYLQARYLFCTGFSAADRRFVVRHCVADSARVFTEPVSRRDMPPVPRTFVGLTRDRALPPRTQLRQVRNLGGARLVVLDSAHDVMVGHPADLAKVVNDVVAGVGQLRR
jgi:pimeloyl-ACP methyl ester carboxylesterase